MSCLLACDLDDFLLFRELSGAEPSHACCLSADPAYIDLGRGGVCGGIVPDFPTDAVLRSASVSPLRKIRVGCPVCISLLVYAERPASSDEGSGDDMGATGFLGVCRER